jgi:hypothetical protein
LSTGRISLLDVAISEPSVFDDAHGFFLERSIRHGFAELEGAR